MSSNIDLAILKQRVAEAEGTNAAQVPVQSADPDAVLNAPITPAAPTELVTAPGTPRERLYKCAQRSMKVHTTDGTEVIFKGGLLHTSDLKIINYLDHQLKVRALPNVFIDPNEPWYDPEKYDMVLRIKNETRRELEAEFAKRLAEVTNPNRNMGNSVQGKLNAASTRDVAAVAAGAGPTTVPMTQVTK